MMVYSNLLSNPTVLGQGSIPNFTFYIYPSTYRHDQASSELPEQSACPKEHIYFL